MKGNDFIIAYLLSKYWVWVLLIVLICIVIANPKTGLWILGFAIVFFLIVFLAAKVERAREVQSKKVWDALSEEEKAIWEEIYTMNPKGGFSYIRGKDVFDMYFKSEFTLFDAFDENFDRPVPFPKDSKLRYEYSLKGKELLKAWNQKQEELANEKIDN